MAEARADGPIQMGGRPDMSRSYEEMNIRKQPLAVWYQCSAQRVIERLVLQILFFRSLAPNQISKADGHLPWWH